MHRLILLTTLLTTSFAQYGAAQSSASATMTSSAASATQTIMVGSEGLVFTPDSVTAAMGSILEFHFASGDHSVAQADFSKPCAPMSENNGGIYSGFPGNGKVFQVMVNNTDPMWLYCSEEGHCQGGMVMVVNQAGSDTLAAFKSAAQGTSDSSAPAQVQGGIVEPLSALSATSSATASSTVTAASSASSMASGAGSATTSAAGAAEAVGKGFQMVGLAMGIPALAWLI